MSIGMLSRTRAHALSGGAVLLLLTACTPDSPDESSALPAVEAVSTTAPSAEPVSEPEPILASVELAPLESGEADEFDDVFVELIEE